METLGVAGENILIFFDGVFLFSFSGVEIVYCLLLYHKDDVDEFPFMVGL